MNLLKKKFDTEYFLSIDGSAVYILSGLILSLMFLLYPQTDEGANKILSQVLVYGSLVVSVVTALWLYYQGKLKVKTMIMLTLICGFCVKLAYAVSMGYQYNQHDVESLGSSGHLQYIYNLAYDNMLPDTNNWQFSHPPLHHFLAALVVKLGGVFGFTQQRCFESIQYLTVFYSTVTMVWFFKILREIGIRGRVLLFATMIFAVHPTFTILAGSINNDILTVMLCTGAIYYLIKWCKTPSFLYAGVLGLLSGLAMMTKFSGTLIVAVIGITVLVKTIRQQNFKLLIQAPVYLAVCLPLGLWYQIRNMRLFAQPLGYVTPLDISSGLYTGDTSIVNRLLIAPIKEMFSLFCDPWEDVNIISYTIKSSVFGEYDWANVGVAFLMLVFNIVMIAMTVYCIVKLLRKKAKDSFEIKFILFLNFFIQIFSFVYFYLKYPFGCTMDFRYIVLTLVSGIAVLAIEANECQMQSGTDRIAHIKTSIFCAVSLGFSLISMILLV